MTDMKLKQIQTSQELDRATKRTTFLENESKIQELSKVKHMEEKLDIANTKIEYFEKQITEKDSGLKSIIEVLYSYTPLPPGQLEWKITGVKQKIQNYEDTYTDPFYVALYKCQGHIRWNCYTVGVYIYIMKGGYDDKLHWPIRYKYTLIVLNHINSNNNYEITNQVTKEDLEKYPNCFKKHTQLSNEGFGIPSFISNTGILEAKYCKEDSITLLIKFRLLQAL
ncbi:hypothetical protein LOD99_11000 [Oopsacas minuta]|uniref:MATH domain-containing protein n=1 Tax=Oopsacas minuta TaxID=111878 RepID=A0AAV7KBW7_9METZ|nr:hypothetical protein LOD99_11000 [Oopsacas minuta]